MAIDFRKAFDSKAFSFIKALLQFFKFSKSLIDWIMILLEDFIVEIIQAGKIFLKNQHRKRIQTRRPNRKSSAHPLYRNPANKNQNSKHSQALQTHIQTKPLQGRNCKKKNMEGFADDITLSIKNSIESLQGVTNIIENFGNLSGLGINKDKTQVMIFCHNSKTAIPTIDTMGFEWVKEIKILGVTIIRNLKDMGKKILQNMRQYKNAKTLVL